MGTRRLLAIVISRSTGRMHILADQGERIAICGRRVEGLTGEYGGEYGGPNDCKQCALVAEGHGRI